MPSESPQPARSERDEELPTLRRRSSSGGGSPPRAPAQSDGSASKKASGRRPIKATLVVIGLLVFVLFAFPEIEVSEVSGLKLAEFARPRLLLGLAVLFSLVALFHALYLNLSAARVNRQPIFLEIDPLSREITQRSVDTFGSEALQLGIVPATLRWLADFSFLVLRFLFVGGLAFAVAWQLREVFIPVIASARSGDAQMQLVVALAALLLLSAGLRAVSCLVVAVSPRRDFRRQFAFVTYPLQLAAYYWERRKARRLAAESLSIAREALKDPATKAAFDKSFERHSLDVDLLNHYGQFWPPDSAPRFRAEWTDLQKWTLLRVLAAYNAEYSALASTKGLREFAVTFAPDDETPNDAFCLSMIEHVRTARTPRSYFKIPEPMASLLLDGTVRADSE